jgi:HPt (histidine-containing phosphotransfer) domain-containing protein
MVITGRANVFDNETFDVASALTRLGGRMSIYRQVLRMFYVEAVTVPDRLAALSAAARRDEMAAVLHQLKASAGAAGAVQLYRSAMEAEVSLGKCEPGSLTAEQLELLKSHIRSAAAVADGILATTVDPQCDKRPPLHIELPLLSEIKSLIALLRASNMEADDVFARIHQRCALAFPDEFQALKSAFDALDFPAASEICKDILLRGADPG